MARNTIHAVLAVVLLAGNSGASDIAAILESRYEDKMISSGKNRPTIRLGKDHLKDVLVLLHHRMTPSSIQAHFGWNDRDFERRIDVLLENDFVTHHSSGRYLPTSMVITLGDAKALQETAAIVAGSAATTIANRVPEIKAFYNGLEPFQEIAFEDASLLILSDVVLDNWQINNVESQFLQKQRTPRHGVNYYYSLQEKGTDQDKESFGIYGNQMWSHGNWMIGVYGNKRLTSKHLLSLSDKDAEDLFGGQAGETTLECRGRILEALMRHASDPDYQLGSKLRSGFNHLGLMEDDQIRIPILDRGDYQDLKNLARLMTGDLVAVLENHRNLLEESYAQSVYAEEITFEEYFIWWYHFFYSEVTEILIHGGLIKSPSSGVTTYVVDWSQ